MSTTNDLQVAATNAEQLRAWDGDEGSYWAAHAEHFDRSVTEHHRRLLAAASIRGGDRVLDIGCGTGQTTRDAARAAKHGMALGVDLSSPMLRVARELAASEGVGNASFLQADAQVHRFEPAAFDIAISRTGAMFFGDREAAFTNIGRALTPGGRLALVAWQGLAGNEWIREISGALAAGRERPAPPPGVPGPFALAEPDTVRATLDAAGFVGVELEGFEADMWFGDDVEDAHQFVVGLMGWMLEGLDDTGRSTALDNLRKTMADRATGDGVVFRSAAWLITATRP